ncbi:haloacid dehalogenase-like hydrolase [Erwinia sp. CPCC 100877]|nr:haloacid dehalogenase-like hydrolase [Erwinia sp. CPCC 100877]
MVKRLISASYSEVAKMSSAELKQSIKASEGRVILSENVVVAAPQAGDISNAEVAAAFGADLLLLNVFDCFNPVVQGIPGMSQEEIMTYWQDPAKNQINPIPILKKLTGRPIGVNLEPVDESSSMFSDKLTISKGRTSSKETFKKAEELGVDFICLTGNPGTGVTNAAIARAVSVAKENFSGLIIAGKMHSAGSDEPVVSNEAVKAYAAAGADILLLPAVGTIQGFTEEDMRAAVKIAKATDLLTMSAIGTSQESASKETIRQIALLNKICGVDIQHIGDAGYGGLAPAENIYAMSLAIRGMRHTINRMARSINR